MQRQLGLRARPSGRAAAMRAPAGVAAASVAFWLTGAWLTAAWLTAAWLMATGACAPVAPAPSWTAVDRLIADRYPEVPQMTTAGLAELLDAGERPVLLLDARTTEEYAVSHLPAARHAPSLEAAVRLVRAAPADAVVVAYCSVGVRSSALAARLREGGVGGVHNLRGSLFAWANEGRSVYRGRTRVADVHPYDAEWGRLLDRTRLEDALHGGTVSGAAPDVHETDDARGVDQDVPALLEGVGRR